MRDLPPYGGPILPNWATMDQLSPGAEVAKAKLDAVLADYKAPFPPPSPSYYEQLAARVIPGAMDLLTHRHLDKAIEAYRSKGGGAFWASYLSDVLNAAMMAAYDRDKAKERVDAEHNPVAQDLGEAKAVADEWAEINRKVAAMPPGEYRARKTAMEAEKGMRLPDRVFKALLAKEL